MVSLLVSLDASTIVLFFIDNPGFVIVVVSSTIDDEGSRSIIVVYAVVDVSGAVLSIIVVDKGASVVVVDITIALIYWSPIIVIFLYVVTGTVVIVFVYIVEIKIIVLDDGDHIGVVVVAVVVDNEGANAVESTHPAFN